MFNLLSSHFSYDWLQETISMIRNVKIGEYYTNSFTLVHVAVMGGLWRLVHEVFLDHFGFDVDFYRLNCKLTLLHVAAKYITQLWNEEMQKQIKRLVERSNNLTLKNNQGFNIL